MHRLIIGSDPGLGGIPVRNYDPDHGMSALDNYKIVAYLLCRRRRYANFSTSNQVDRLRLIHRQYNVRCGNTEKLTCDFGGVLC